MSKYAKFLLITAVFMTLALCVPCVPVSCVFMTVGLVSSLFALDNFKR